MRWDDPAGFGAPRYGSDFFGLARGKILILLRLRGLDRPSSRQNIGSKGLTGKILRNKGLAAWIGPAAFVSE
jgi:hypothetical protein